MRLLASLFFITSFILETVCMVAGRRTTVVSLVLLLLGRKVAYLTFCLFILISNLNFSFSRFACINLSYIDYLRVFCDSDVGCRCNGQKSDRGKSYLARVRPAIISSYSFLVRLSQSSSPIHLWILFENFSFSSWLLSQLNRDLICRGRLHCF
jgi:hypothetical protein